MATDIAKSNEIDEITREFKGSTLEMYRDITARMPGAVRLMLDIVEDTGHSVKDRVAAFKALSEERKSIYEGFKGKDGKDPFEDLLEDELKRKCGVYAQNFSKWVAAGMPTFQEGSVIDAPARTSEPSPTPGSSEHS